MVKVNAIPVFGAKKYHYHLLEDFHQNVRRNHYVKLAWSTLQNTDRPVFFKLGSCRLCEGFGYNSRNILELLCAIFPSSRDHLFTE